jgi:hypothetical protein
MVKLSGRDYREHGSQEKPPVEVSIFLTHEDPLYEWMIPAKVRDGLSFDFVLVEAQRSWEVIDYRHAVEQAAYYTGTGASVGSFACAVLTNSTARAMDGMTQAGAKDFKVWLHLLDFLGRRTAIISSLSSVFLHPPVCCKYHLLGRRTAIYKF